MRRGTKLIALAALGALAIPVPSQAVQLEVAGDLVKEVVVTAQVQKFGTTKKGTFSLTLRESQGLSVVKPPVKEKLDKVAIDQHVGEGLPAGLPQFTGCMTLKISGVVNQTHCTVYGNSASLEAEPGLTAVSVSATMAEPEDWRTTFALNLEASDTTPTQESVERTTDVRPTTKAGGGYLIEAGEGLKRDGVLVGGTIYDTTPGAGAIAFIPNTESVTMRQYVRAHSALDRQAVACGGGENKGIVIGAAEQNPDLFKPGTQTPFGDVGEDGEEEYLAVPAGCHPDDDFSNYEDQVNDVSPVPIVLP